MSSPLNILRETAERDPTVECFIVSPVTWAALERDAEDYLDRFGTVNHMRGTWSMTVMGVPVGRTRISTLEHVPFIEAHCRGFDGTAFVRKIL